MECTSVINPTTIKQQNREYNSYKVTKACIVHTVAKVCIADIYGP